jgi:hypothetical protein
MDYNRKDGYELKLEDILNSNYLESDTPELLITENGHISNIILYIIESLDDNLKKNFKENRQKQEEFIDNLSEDYGFIEKLRSVSDNLLEHIIGSYGELEISKTQNNNINSINSIWKFSREEVNNLDKENRKYYCRF